MTEAESVSPDFLLDGASAELEQAGLLVTDAVRLYDLGSYPNAAVLAHFGQESIGRCRILLGLRERLLARQAVTVAEVRDACKDHVVNQREGMFAVGVTGKQGTEVFNLVMTSMSNEATEAERAKAKDNLDQLAKRKKKRQPHDQHSSRMKALYVEPDSNGHSWSGPSDVTAEQAMSVLLDAMNAYSVCRNGASSLPGLPEALALRQLPEQSWPKEATEGPSVPMTVKAIALTDVATAEACGVISEELP